MHRIILWLRSLRRSGLAHYPTSRKPYLIAEHIRSATPGLR